MNIKTLANNRSSAQAAEGTNALLCTDLRYRVSSTTTACRWGNSIADYFPVSRSLTCTVSPALSVKWPVETLCGLSFSLMLKSYQVLGQLTPAYLNLHVATDAYEDEADPKTAIRNIRSWSRQRTTSA